MTMKKFLTISIFVLCVALLGCIAAIFAGFYGLYQLNHHKTDMSIHIKDADDLKTRLTEAGEKLVIIDFMATWCGPCKVIGPKLDEMAQEFADTIVVLKIDVDECEDIAAEYEISSMPTFIFVKNSQKIEEFSGANADKLRNTVLKLK